MTRFKLDTAESEAVERAFYEAQSFEAIVSILARELKEGGNAETANVLTYYADRCRCSQMRLKMAQDKVLALHGLNIPGRRYRFDFTREEVVLDETEA